MRHYFTAAEFNQYNNIVLSDKPMEDEHSRNVIEKLLQEHLPYKKLRYSKGKCYYDLMMTKTDNTKSALEIKYRYENHYDTMIINDEKYKSFYKNVSEGKIKDGHLFTMWNDGQIWVSNILAEHETGWRLQNETTNVSNKTDGKKVWKLCHFYKPQTIWYYAYFYDWEEGKYEPIFSSEPIDIKKLEDKYNELSTVELF